MSEDQPSPKAYVAFVFSFLGCLSLGGCVLSLLGVILSWEESSRITRGESPRAGRDLTTAALTIGSVGLFLQLAAIAFVLMELVLISQQGVQLRLMPQ